MRPILLLALLSAAAILSAALLASSHAHAADLKVDAAEVKVDAADLYFCSQSFQGAVCEKTITVGDSVTWKIKGGTHTITQCSFTTCPRPTASIPAI